MSLLHHAHHWQPFDDTDDTERHRLIERANDLAHACAEKDRHIAHLEAELARARRPTSRLRLWAEHHILTVHFKKGTTHP